MAKIKIVRAHELAKDVLDNFKQMEKEPKYECYTCIYAPNNECGWNTACCNCIDGSNYWRKKDEHEYPENGN